MELFFIVRALKRASVKSITVIVPYYGYARQDRRDHNRVPISASDVAMMIETAGADGVVTIDLHSDQIQGFFHHIPVSNLRGSTIIIPYFAKKELRNPVIISPDAGGVLRAKAFREDLALVGVNTGFGVIIKQRSGPGAIETMNLVGDVRDCDVIIVDDICDT
jgi:ribose-phosphate pyrophosphokinase